MGDLGEGLLAAKPADGAAAFSFIDELDRSLWDVVIAFFDAGVYVRCRTCFCHKALRTAHEI